MQFVKRTGLAVVLALALGVSLGATAASASYFTAGSYPATFEGIASSQEYSNTRSFTCVGAGLNSETTLFGKSETLSPTFFGAECPEGGREFETGTKLAMNGCRYTFHAESEVEPGRYEGTADLGPVGCGPMTLNGSRCERKFNAQSGIPATLRNVGSGEKAAVKAEIVNGNLQYTSVGQLTSCGAAFQSLGFTGSWELTAYNVYGEQIPASVSGLPLIGVSLAGEESAEEAKKPHFQAESYPVAVNARQNTINGENYKFELEGTRPLTCEQASLLGNLSGSATKVALTPDFRNCTMTILGNPDPAVVTANSCSLGLNALNVGPPYAGSLDVSCAKEGEGIEVLVYASAHKQAEGQTLCSYKIGAQSGLKSVSMRNRTASPEISITFAIGGMAVTKTKGTLTNCGAANLTGSFGGGGIMSGH